MSPTPFWVLVGSRLICIPLPSLFQASPCVRARVRVIVRPSGRGRPFLPFSLSFHPISLADAFPHGARAEFEMHFVQINWRKSSASGANEEFEFPIKGITVHLASPLSAECMACQMPFVIPSSSAPLSPPLPLDVRLERTLGNSPMMLAHF